MSIQRLVEVELLTCRSMVRLPSLPMQTSARVPRCLEQLDWKEVHHAGRPLSVAVLLVLHGRCSAGSGGARAGPAQT